jgi:hypothetical protein
MLRRPASVFGIAIRWAGVPFVARCHWLRSVAARWLRLYIEERPVSIDEIAWVVACLKQLGGPHHLAALGVLRAAAG